MTEKKGQFVALLRKVNEIAASAQIRTQKLRLICELLESSVPYYNWVGFYLVGDKERELVLGPFVGEPTEHAEIPFGKGICGQAAESKKTFIVQDVSKETNYLACNLNVKSEIVIPILKDGKVIGELDIDSHATSPFTDDDESFLEGVAGVVSGLF